MSAASFGAILVLSRAGFEADTIDDFKGLSARSPWMAGMVLCVMASLAGVPPFLGFWAKLVVLRAAVNGDLMWLALVGVVCAVIGAFYYLRVIKVMYSMSRWVPFRCRVQVNLSPWCLVSMHWVCWCWESPGIR